MMKRFLKQILFYLSVTGICAFSLFPFYWAIVSSLETGSALFEPDLFPTRLTGENYTAIFIEQSFGQNILNSVGVASLTVILSLLLGLSTAYALGRRNFCGRKLLLYSLLGISMIPQIAILSGLFELIRGLGLYNSWTGLVLSYMIFTLPFTVWVLSTFMRDIPRSLEEAAIIDGAKPLTIITRIFVPILAPSIVTTGLLAFIFAWNEFLFALTLTLTDEARTVPVAIALLSGASQHELPWGRVMAASVIITVPLIILVLAFQRRIVAGLTAGSVKG